MASRQHGFAVGGLTVRRREMMGGLLAAGALLGGTRIAHAAGSSLNFVSYGGSYGDSVEKYLLAPFRAKTGIAVTLGVNSTLAGSESANRIGSV